MRRLATALLVMTVFVSTPRAQDALTREQRVLDLTQLASFYAKNYAPYEWKRETLGFDLLRLTPWLARIWRADDLQFQEALIEYVASLNDAHDLIAFPTNFSASLGLTVDIYDGTVLIDSINRTRLPAAQFPFEIGDELVALDDRSAQQLIQSFRKYAIAANRRSTDRVAASRIVSRSQQLMPHLPDIRDSARAVIRLAATGAKKTFEIPWLKVGIPITSQGPVPTPGLGHGRLSVQPEALAATPDAAGAEGSVFQVADLAAADNTLPSYMAPIRALLNADVSKDYFSVLGNGSRFPIYAPPPGFVLRPVPPGQPASFLSGTYVADGLRIGLIRIPSMSPPNVAIALQQLDQEIAFFNANTDALIVDVMRNPGGLVSFVEAISQRFIPTPFQTVGFEIRATAAWVFSFASQLTAARQANAPPEIIENLQRNYDEVVRAYNEKRGRSAAVSLNATGSLTLQPSPNAYLKPLMVLTDEFSASGGDMFPAIIQDNGRGPIFGMRTMGAGGSVVGFNGTAFTESFFRVTVSLMNRGTQIVTPDFPPAPYIENIGVRPNIVSDYMTRANLVGGGAPFVQAFTQAIVNLARTTSH